MLYLLRLILKAQNIYFSQHCTSIKSIKCMAILFPHTPLEKPSLQTQSINYVCCISSVLRCWCWIFQGHAIHLPLCDYLLDGTHRTHFPSPQQILSVNADTLCTKIRLCPVCMSHRNDLKYRHQNHYIAGGMIIISMDTMYFLFSEKRPIFADRPLYM